MWSSFWQVFLVNLLPSPAVWHLTSFWQFDIFWASVWHLVGIFLTPLQPVMVQFLIASKEGRYKLYHGLFWSGCTVFREEPQAVKYQISLFDSSKWAKGHLRFTCLMMSIGLTLGALHDLFWSFEKWLIGHLLDSFKCWCLKCQKLHNFHCKRVL